MMNVSQEEYGKIINTSGEISLKAEQAPYACAKALVPLKQMITDVVNAFSVAFKPMNY